MDFLEDHTSLQNVTKWNDLLKQILSTVRFSWNSVRRWIMLRITRRLRFLAESGPRADLYKIFYLWFGLLEMSYIGGFFVVIKLKATLPLWKWAVNKSLQKKKKRNLFMDRVT